MNPSLEEMLEERKNIGDGVGELEAKPFCHRLQIPLAPLCNNVGFQKLNSQVNELGKVQQNWFQVQSRQYYFLPFSLSLMTYAPAEGQGNQGQKTQRLIDVLRCHPQESFSMTQQHHFCSSLLVAGREPGWSHNKSGGETFTYDQCNIKGTILASRPICCSVHRESGYPLQPLSFSKTNNVITNLFQHAYIPIGWILACKPEMEMFGQEGEKVGKVKAPWQLQQQPCPQSPPRGWKAPPSWG